MTFVRIKPGDNFDDAMRKFKKKVEKDGIIQEFKKRQYYEKPSDTKRRKRMEAIRKARSKRNKRKR